MSCWCWTGYLWLGLQTLTSFHPESGHHMNCKSVLVEVTIGDAHRLCKIFAPYGHASIQLASFGPETRVAMVWALDDAP